MLEFAFGISVAINIILFIAIYIVFKFMKHFRKKNSSAEEVVDFDAMKDFLGSDKL